MLALFYVEIREVSKFYYFFRLCEFSVNSVSLWWEFVSSIYNNHAMI